MQSKQEEASIWRRLWPAWASTPCPEATNRILCTKEVTWHTNTTLTEDTQDILTSTAQALKPWMKTSAMPLRTQMNLPGASPPTGALKRQQDLDNPEHIWTTSCKPPTVMTIFLLVKESMHKCPTAKASSATMWWTNMAMNCITQGWWATCPRCRIKLHLTFSFLMSKEVDKGQPASMEARGTTTRKVTRARRTSEERVDNTLLKKKALNMIAIVSEQEVSKPTISIRGPILLITQTTGIRNQTLVSWQAPQEATTLTPTLAQVQAQKALQFPRKGRRKENQRRRRPKKP